jgi:hypothetical protein
MSTEADWRHAGSECGDRLFLGGGGGRPRDGLGARTPSGVPLLPDAALARGCGSICRRNRRHAVEGLGESWSRKAAPPAQPPGSAGSLGRHKRPVDRLDVRTSDRRHASMRVTRAAEAPIGYDPEVRGWFDLLPVVVDLPGHRP